MLGGEDGIPHTGMDEKSWNSEKHAYGWYNGEEVTTTCCTSWCVTATSSTGRHLLQQRERRQLTNGTEIRERKDEI